MGYTLPKRTCRREDMDWVTVIIGVVVVFAVIGVIIDIRQKNEDSRNLREINERGRRQSRD